MTSFVTAFGTILSELPTNLKARIPLSILLPLAITIAALLSIFARVHGLNALQKLWTDATIVEQTLLSALALAVFYVVAYVLAALQPVVEQGFQQAFGIPGLKRVLAGAHRDEWKHRSIEERLWRNLYNDLKRENTAVNDLLNGKAEAPGAKTVVPATTSTIVPSVLPPIDNPSPPSDEEESTGGEKDATEALRERLLRNPWFRGMHQVTVTCVEADLPDELNVESIVRLIDRSVPSSQLVPGGALIVARSPLPAAANRLPGMDLVQVTMAVPPDRVNGINVAQAAGSVGIFVRPTPEPTPIWDDSIDYTRRWIPTPDPSPECSPGDLVDIAVTNGNGMPITLNRVIFAEVTDGGWAIAVPLDQAELVAGVPAASVTAGRSNVAVQKFKSRQDQWTYWQNEPIEGLESIQGEVHSGIFKIKDGASDHPDVVIHTTELVGRYAVETIEANTPIERRKLGPSAADRDKVIIVTRPESIERLGDGEWAHFFKEQVDGEKVDVAFNLQTLPENMIIVPKDFTFDGFEFSYSSRHREKFNLGNAWFRMRLDISPGLAETPFVLSRSPLTKADLWSGRLAKVSRPWRAMHAVQLKQNDLAFDDNPRVILGDVDAISVTNRFPGTSSVMPYPSPTSYQDTALAIAQRLQDCQFSRKRLLTAHSILPTENETLMKAILRQFRNDAQLMLSDCQTWADHSRISTRLFYPRERSSVQPTAIGNILASVESYGYHTYGLDTPLVFARLRNLLSTDELTSVNDAHEQFRFTQWCMLASIAIGTVGSTIAAHGHERWLMFSLWFVMLIVAPFLLRRAMVSAALAYAEQLRSILDRYRGRVFGSMGISPEMDDKEQTTAKHEKQRWKELAQWWEYSNAELPGKYTLDRGPETAASAEPGEAKAES